MGEYATRFHRLTSRRAHPTVSRTMGQQLHIRAKRRRRISWIERKKQAARKAKPAAPQPAETKPAEVKPAEVKPTEVKTAEVKPPEVKA